MSGPAALCSARAPNDWRRAVARVDLNMQLVQKVEHLFGRMVVRSRMSRPAALCSAGAPNDWRRAVARVDLNMQLAQKVEHLFGRMGCKHQRCLKIILALTRRTHICDVLALRGRAAPAATASRPCEAFGFEFLSHAKQSREKKTVQSTASATARRAKWPAPSGA